MRETISTETRDGFEIRITAEPDTCPDLSYLGHFQANRCCRDCIDRKKAGTWERNQFEFFHPETWKGEGSHKQARAQWQEMEAFARGDKCMMVVGVHASKNGVKLGVDYLGGVEDSYAEGAVKDHDMIENAIAMARKTLESLCECK